MFVPHHDRHQRLRRLGDGRYGLGTGCRGLMSGDDKCLDSCKVLKLHDSGPCH